MARHETSRVPPPRPGGGAPRIDWASAYAYFESDPTRTYGDVARRFGVSDTAVRRHARAGGDTTEGWQEARAATIAEAAAAQRGRTVRAYQERMADDIALLDKLRAVVLEAEDIAIEQALRALPRLLKYERLYEGESTESIDIGEARETYQALIDAFREFVDDTSGSVKERRERFLAKMASLQNIPAAA